MVGYTAFLAPTYGRVHRFLAFLPYISIIQWPKNYVNGYLNHIIFCIL